MYMYLLIYRYLLYRSFIRKKMMYVLNIDMSCYSDRVANEGKQKSQNTKGEISEGQK
jgi:hypothetical protein